MGNKASSKSEPASPSTSAPASPAPPPRQAPAHAPAPAAPVPAAKAKPAAAKLAKKTPIGGNLKPHPATAFPTPMAPMKLTCRGADPRAMKAFIAAAISGADVKFVPMAKGAEGHGGSPIALAVSDDGALVLSEANAVARYLGAAKALAPAGAARWTAERWCEWEASTLAPAVAVACASNDGAPLQAILAGTL